MLRRLQVLVCAAGLMAGCAVTPDYERPELAPPGGWRQPADAGESIANLAWWELYQDEALQQLVRAALADNRDLAAALARVEESRYLVTFTRADQFPFLDAFGSAGRGRSSGRLGVPARTSNTFGIGAMLSFEVDLWRRFARATEGARADLLSSEAAYRNVTIQLVSDVATTYFLLRDLDARLEISRRTTAGRRDRLDIIRARFDKGTVPELDVNQAEIELSISQAAVAAFERQVAQTENALRVLIGSYPGEIPRGAPLVEQTVPPELPAGLPVALLERRPDVVAAEQALVAETARTGVAEALRYPAITLSGSISTLADDVESFATAESKAWDIAGDVFQPLFNSGQLRAQAKAQGERAVQALNAYEGAVQTAYAEVEDALVAVRTLREEAAARERQVVAARNAARLSRARYNAGVVDYLEVLDTQRTLFSSELDESATRQQALSAVVLLYRALGGGWTADPATTTPSPPATP